MTGTRAKARLRNTPYKQAMGGGGVPAADYYVTSEATWTTVFANTDATLSNKVVEISAGTTLSHKTMSSRTFTGAGLVIRCENSTASLNSFWPSSVEGLHLGDQYRAFNIQAQDWPHSRSPMLAYGGRCPNVHWDNVFVRGGYGATFLNSPVTSTTTPELQTTEDGLNTTTSSVAHALSWQFPSLSYTRNGAAGDNWSRVTVRNESSTETVAVKLGDNTITVSGADYHLLLAPKQQGYINSGYSGLSATTIPTHIAVITTSGSGETYSAYTAGLTARAETSFGAWYGNGVGKIDGGLSVDNFYVKKLVIEDCRDAFEFGLGYCLNQQMDLITVRRCYQDALKGTLKPTQKSYNTRILIEQTPWCIEGTAIGTTVDPADPHGDANQAFGYGSGVDPAIVGFPSSGYPTSTCYIDFGILNTVATGDPIVFSGGGTLPTPLSTGVTYYVIKIADRRSCYLATSYANAIAETAISLTAVGSGTNYHDLDNNGANIRDQVWHLEQHNGGMRTGAGGQGVFYTDQWTNSLNGANENYRNILFLNSLITSKDANAFICNGEDTVAINCTQLDSSKTDTGSINTRPVNGRNGGAINCIAESFLTATGVYVGDGGTTQTTLSTAQNNYSLPNGSAGHTAALVDWTTFSSSFATRGNLNAKTGGPAAGLGFMGNNVINWNASYGAAVSSIIDWANVPTCIQFNALYEQTKSATITSNWSRVMGGLVTGMSVSVSGASGEYRIADDENGTNATAWTSTPGTVDQDKFIQVRGLSSASNATSTTVTLTLNGDAHTFLITTVTTPFNIVTWEAVTPDYAERTYASYGEFASAMPANVQGVVFAYYGNVLGAANSMLFQVYNNNGAGNTAVMAVIYSGTELRMFWHGGYYSTRVQNFFRASTGVNGMSIISADFTAPTLEEGVKAYRDGVRTESYSFSTWTPTNLGDYNNMDSYYLNTRNTHANIGAAESGLFFMQPYTDVSLMPDIGDPEVRNRLVLDNIGSDGSGFDGNQAAFCIYGSAAGFNAGTVNGGYVGGFTMASGAVV